MSDLSELGTDSGGVWTRQQALRLLTRGEIDTLVRDRTWQVVWRGVYADGGHLLDAEQRAWAAVLASGGADQPVPFGPPDPITGERRRRLRAVACGRTAARVLGIPLIDDDDATTGAHDLSFDEVAVWRHAIPTTRFGKRTLQRRQLRFRDGDVVRLPSGLWTTSALRTLIDCATLLTHEALVCALDHALHVGLVTTRDLDAAAARRCGDVGADALRRAVAAADGRAEAPSETLARLLLLPHLPGLVPQYRLLDGAGRLIARFDLGDDALRLAVEADGRANHAGDAMVAKDQRRDMRTERFRWTTERVRWFELRREQSQVVARVVGRADALRPAGR